MNGKTLGAFAVTGGQTRAGFGRLSDNRKPRSSSELAPDSPGTPVSNLALSELGRPAKAASEGVTARCVGSE